jgi:hypothetical protein
MSTAREKLLRSGQGNNLPREIEMFKNLYILFKGDYQKMEWFYENRTEADLMLMICIHNMTQGFDE